jgi:hypothetical protein
MRPSAGERAASRPADVARVTDEPGRARIMMSRITKLALSSCLVMCLGVASVPLGCGGSEEAFHAVPRPREDPKVPERVAKQLEECVKQASAPFPPAEGSTYAVTFEVQASRGGSVHAVELKDSTLGGHEVEACFGRVLQEMTLPKRTIAAGLEGAPPRGAAAPADRALVGHAIAIPNPFSLLPVVLTFAAVCIVVAVTVHVVSEVSAGTTTVAPPVVTAIPVASAVPTTTALPIPTVVPRDPAMEAHCLALQLECLENKPQPPRNRRRFGKYKDCGACFRYCMREKGQWPFDNCPRD